METQIIVVDTDVIIDYAHDKFPVLSIYLKQQKDKKVRLYISAITLFEYYSSNYFIDQRLLDQTDMLFAGFTVYEVTEEIAKMAAKINRERKLHQKIESNDLLIAVTALYLDAELLTKNKKHFRAIPGLKFAS